MEKLILSSLMLVGTQAWAEPCAHVEVAVRPPGVEVALPLEPPPLYVQPPVYVQQGWPGHAQPVYPQAAPARHPYYYGYPYYYGGYSRAYYPRGYERWGHPIARGYGVRGSAPHLGGGRDFGGGGHRR